jgi:hypothetical protein
VATIKVSSSTATTWSGPLVVLNERSCTPFRSPCSNRPARKPGWGTHGRAALAVTQVLAVLPVFQRRILDAIPFTA